jgi:uncharacterized protein YgiM (DUF1202 family)
MSRKKLTLLVLMILTLVCVPGPEEVGSTSIRLQTIPTRTPTPAPSSPTSPPPTIIFPPTVPPTNSPTPIPPTPVSSPFSVATSTPASVPIPTAESCGEPPTIRTQNIINVRAGPGAGYEVIATLDFPEVRYITGRALDVPWWLIELSQGIHGWVADAVVATQGYTTDVPIALAPPLNGQTPTPGIAWAPTPNPDCSAAQTPVPTNTLSATATQTVQSVPSANTVSSVSLTPHNSGEGADATISSDASEAISSPLESASTPADPQTADSDNQEGANANGIVGNGSLTAPTSQPLGIEESSGTSSLLLIAGIILIAVAMLLAIWNRRDRRT